jgi:hypothetical protein
MLTGFSPAIAEDKTAPAVQCNFHSMLWATDYYLMHLGGEVDAAMTDSLARSIAERCDRGRSAIADATSHTYPILRRSSGRAHSCHSIKGRVVGIQGYRATGSDIPYRIYPIIILLTVSYPKVGSPHLN